MLQQKHRDSLFWYIVSPLILVGLTVLTYLPSLHYAFQFDDEPNILKYYEIRYLTLRDLCLGSSRWISKWVSVWSYHFGKFEPFFYRCANLSFHVITGVLVYYFFFVGLSGIKKSSFFGKHARIISVLTAGMFLLHPVQTQTVSYIVQGQMEGLAGLFVMATALCFLLFARSENRAWSITALVGMYVCALLACGTKEIAIVTPFMVLITDWFFVAQGSWSSIKKRWWVHASVFGLVWGMYIWFLGKKYFIRAFGLQLAEDNIPGNCLTNNIHDKIMPASYMMSQFKVILHYMVIFLWPFNICMEYDWRLEPSISSLGFVLPFLGVLTIVAFIGYLLRGNKKSLIAFGLMWFFIGIAPRSSIIPAWELVVDYKTYIACIGWIFLLASGLVYLYVALTKRSPHLKTGMAQIVAVCLFASFLMFITVQRNYVWESGYNFWEDVIAKAPGKARSHNNFGCQFLAQEKYREAIPYFKRAIRMEGGYYDPYNNLSFAYGALGRIDQAIWALRQGLKIYPYQPKVYNNMATFLILKNEYQLAVNAAAQAIELYPYYGKAYFNKGRAHLALEQEEDAWECFKACCTRADFDNVSQGYSLYGDLSLKLKKYDDAIFAFTKLYEVEKHPKVLFHLGNAHYFKKDYNRAIECYDQAYRADPRNISIVHNLCEAYLANKQPIQALEAISTLEQSPKKYPTIPIKKATAHLQCGNKIEAARILNRFIQSNPSAEYAQEAQHMLQAMGNKP